MPANTAIKICSRASILMGGIPIQSFSEGTTEADVVDAMYEDIARAALTNTRWRFATNQAQLSRLEAAPTGRFDAAYQLPNDLIMLSAVTIGDEPIMICVAFPVLSKREQKRSCRHLWMLENT